MSERCSVCNFTFKNNSRIIACAICQSMIHLKCTRFNTQDYKLISCDNSWSCESCLSELFPFNHIIDDDAFHFTLQNAFHNSDINLDYDRLNSNYFNPFLSDSDTRHLLNNSDIDPNSNIFLLNSQILSSCAYYTTREFNNLFTKKPNCFSTLHMNIRSLKKNFDDFIEYLSTINLSFSVIALSETWLNDSSSDSFHIPGYNFVAKSRKHRIGGGVGIFIKSSFTYKFRPDLELASNELTESIFLEITQSENKNIIIGCIYKPPNVEVEQFNDFLTSIVTKIGYENKICYIFRLLIFNLNNIRFLLILKLGK